MLKVLLKQPFYVIALILGALLVAFPYLTVDKDYHVSSHARTVILPIVVGICLLILATAAFAFTLYPKRDPGSDSLDLTRVGEADGVLSVKVNECEVRVVQGQIEAYSFDEGTVAVLPCNEYFDDDCVRDKRSALGAYANRVYDGQVAEFSLLIKREARSKFGAGEHQERAAHDWVESFGVGRCLFLEAPLGRSTAVALVSTTTHRVGEGLSSKITYLFCGMRELVARLAEKRGNHVVMPVLGAGHGALAPPLAFVGLLLAVAEAIRYAPGGQCLKRATIIVFKRDSKSPAHIDPIIIRRALALVASGS